MPKSSSIRIAPTDLVSGRQYLNLVNDFKAYDQRRNRYLRWLEERVEFLRKEHPERAEFYRAWQGARHYEKVIKSLSESHDRMLQRCASLESRLQTLLKRIDELEETTL